MSCKYCGRHLVGEAQCCPGGCNPAAASSASQNPYYRSVLLKRGTEERMDWIPEHLAVEQNVLDGWVVAWVGTARSDWNHRTVAAQPSMVGAQWPNSGTRTTEQRTESAGERPNVDPRAEVRLGFLILLFLFGVTIFPAIVHYNMQFARDNGFKNWLLFGEIVPTAKGFVWPYFALDLGRSSATPATFSNVDHSQPAKQVGSPVSSSIVPSPAASISSEAPSSPKPESQSGSIIPLSQLGIPVKTICVTMKFFVSDGVSRVEFTPPRSMDHQLDEALESAGYKIVPCTSAHVRFRVTMTGSRSDSPDRSDTKVAVDMRATAGKRSGHYVTEVSTRKFSQDQDGTAYILGFGMAKVMKDVDPQFKLPPAGQ